MISFFLSILLKRIFSGRSFLWKLFFETFSILFTVALIYYAAESFSIRTEVGGEERGSLFVFLIVGEITLLLSMSISERLLAHFLEIRHQQFYQTLLGLRISPNKFIISKTFADSIFPLFRIIVLLSFSVFFMNLHFSSYMFFSFCLIQVLAIFIFSFMSLITSLIYLKFNKGIGFFYTLQSFAAIAGGLYFPISVFPSYFKNVSLLIPQTQLLESSRMIFSGKALEFNSLLILLVWFFGLMILWIISNRIIPKNLKENARFF